MWILNADMQIRNQLVTILVIELYIIMTQTVLFQIPFAGSALRRLYCDAPERQHSGRVVVINDPTPFP